MGGTGQPWPGFHPTTRGGLCTVPTGGGEGGREGGPTAQSLQPLQLPRGECGHTGWAWGGRAGGLGGQPPLEAAPLGAGLQSVTVLGHTPATKRTDPRVVGAAGE